MSDWHAQYVDAYRRHRLEDQRDYYAQRARTFDRARRSVITSSAVFMVLAVAFGLFLHRTRWGRAIYAIGANPVASEFARIRVDRYRFVLFALTGTACGLAAVLLTSRLGSTRPSIAQGWELEIISMVILGGVSVWGGKGSILGVVLAALVFGLVTFGLGLMNIPGIVMSIFTGTLLILVVALPALVRRR